MAVVTVSRQFGAGGVRVAERLAETLGWTKVEREILEEAARRLGVDPEVAEHLDERAPGLIEDAGLALAAAGPDYGVAAPLLLDDQALAGSVGRVIESLADRGGYVILGRGGQAVLRDRPDACHLQLVGELDDRVRRIAEWHGLREDEARERIHQV
jgi:cytidylate kinase